MNKNQKIALGCGGAGCLGLLVFALVGAVVWVTYQRRPLPQITTRIPTRARNINARPANSSNNMSSSMSDDDRHRLFQAAARCGDQELMSRVMNRIGLSESQQQENQQFMKDHLIWIFKNGSFIKEINTQEKARAYVEDHVND